MNMGAKQSLKKEKIVLGSVLALLWLFYVYLAAQIPYTHDDWDWGLANGWYQLFYANLNSRYSGNFVEVLLTRSELFKTLFMGSVFWALPAAAAWFAKDEQTSVGKMLILLLSANAAFLTIRTVIWQQTYGWVAGFANFVASALWLVLYFLLCRDIFAPKGTAKNIGKLRLIGEILLCFTLQLFLENVTVFMVGVGLVFFIGTWIKEKKPSWRYFLHLLALVFGAAVMFSSNMYDTLLATGQAVDGYRQLTFDPNQGLAVAAMGFIRRFVSDFLPEVYGQNWLMCPVIALLMFGHCLKTTKGWGRLGVLFLHTAVTLLLVICYGSSSWCAYVPAKWVISLPLLSNILFFGLILGEIVLCFRRKGGFFWQAAGVWLAAFLVNVPLVVINTVGYRSFLTPYVFLVMFLLLLLNAFALKRQSLQKVGVLVLLAANVALMLHWGAIYRDIGQVNRERLEIMAEARAADADEITLPKFPHEEYLWAPDPQSDYRRKYFKMFYGLKDDVVLVFSDREEIGP